MLYLTICDDEKTQLSLLEGYLRQWAGERKCEIEIDLCQSAEQFLFRQGYEGKSDILLLDIDMPGKSGISLARELREKGENLQIIFVTGLEDYVLEGYDVEAVSYLIKPVKRERLFFCLDKARSRCGREEPSVLLQTAGGIVRLKVQDISYLESDAHDTRVHCIKQAGEVIRCKTGIHELEELLGKYSEAFFKTHRSYLVNLSCISRITRKELEMETGERLPIARGRWEALNKAYLEYYGRRICLLK